MSVVSDRSIGIVSLNHKYIYGTSIGHENTNRPELTDHKHCNILFELNTHSIDDDELCRNVLNTVLHSEKNNVIWTDIGAFENILMSLNDASKCDINCDDCYTNSDECAVSRITNLKPQNKYDAVAPFNEIILKNVLTEKDIFIDFSKSIPLSGPVSKLINILKPKAVAATDRYHCVINHALNDRTVSVLVDGLTTNDFPLQIPARRCFFAPNYSNVLQTLYMVIAPYSESIIPENSSKEYNSIQMFTEVGLSTLNFNVGGTNQKEIVQYPSYAISYMIVPRNWSEEAVALEVIKRCSHYTQSANLNLETCREIAVLQLGEVTYSLHPSTMISKNIDNTDMLTLQGFYFSPGQWYHRTYTYKRNITTQRGNLLCNDGVMCHSTEKEIPVTSLSARLFRSQLDDHIKISSENQKQLNHWGYNNLINKKKNNTDLDIVDNMVLNSYISHCKGEDSDLLKTLKRELDVTPLINILTNASFKKKSKVFDNGKTETDIDSLRPGIIRPGDELLWEKYKESNLHILMELIDKQQEIQSLNCQNIELEQEYENTIIEKHALQNIVTVLERTINDLHEKNVKIEQSDSEHHQVFESQHIKLESNVLALEQLLQKENGIKNAMDMNSFQIEMMQKEVACIEQDIVNSIKAQQEVIKEEAELIEIMNEYSNDTRGRKLKTKAKLTENQTSEEGHSIREVMINDEELNATDKTEDEPKFSDITTLKQDMDPESYDESDFEHKADVIKDSKKRKARTEDAYQQNVQKPGKKKKNQINKPQGSRKDVSHHSK